MSTDPQVALLQRIAEPASLHDVLLEKYDSNDRDPGNLFTVRLLICGRKKGELPLSAQLESCATAAAEKADLKNPLISKREDSFVNSLLIDYGSSFIQLLEGPERYIYGYMSGLNRPKDLLRDVHVLFFEDDVEGFLPPGWVSIDKVPPACVEGDPQDKSDDEIADAVVRDLQNLREMGKASGEAGRARLVLFADNAKVNYPKLFPKLSMIDAYIESDLFLTLDEFVENFCRFPAAPRECEVTHPMEDPLKY